jgi:hypothetical protein
MTPSHPNNRLTGLFRRPTPLPPRCPPPHPPPSKKGGDLSIASQPLSAFLSAALEKGWNERETSEVRQGERQRNGTESVVVAAEGQKKSEYCKIPSQASSSRPLLRYATSSLCTHPLSTYPSLTVTVTARTRLAEHRVLPFRVGAGLLFAV